MSAFIIYFTHSLHLNHDYANIYFAWVVRESCTIARERNRRMENAEWNIMNKKCQKYIFQTGKGKIRELKVVINKINEKVPKPRQMKAWRNDEHQQ